MTDLLAHSAWPGSSDTLRALELTVVALGEIVPWRYPPRREMQFGEWLREDIEAGRFEPAMVDHDLAILITKLRRHSSALLGPAAAELFEEVLPHLRSGHLQPPTCPQTGHLLSPDRTSGRSQDHASR